jgi:hypothetical protein
MIPALLAAGMPMGAVLLQYLYDPSRSDPYKMMPALLAAGMPMGAVLVQYWSTHLMGGAVYTVQSVLSVDAFGSVDAFESVDAFGIREDDQ